MRALFLPPLLGLASCGGLSYYGADDGRRDTNETGGIDGDDDDDTVGITGENCFSAGDEDGDGSWDCDDAECAATCDADHDGSLALSFGGDDCDDTDPAVSPTAYDDCDDQDDDCDGARDEGDGDGDGSTACDDCDDGDGARFPGASETCDGVDSDCDGQDCVADFSDDFESGAFGGAWLVGGDSPWIVSQNDHHGGSWMARSGDIDDTEISTLDLTLTFDQAGDITFWHKGGTEQGFDYLRFFVDDVQVGIWSGVWNWQEASYSVPAGIHTFSWRYRKDRSNSRNGDVAKLDDVLATHAHP